MFIKIERSSYEIQLVECDSVVNFYNRDSEEYHHFIDEFNGDVDKIKCIVCYSVSNTDEPYSNIRAIYNTDKCYVLNNNGKTVDRI